MRPVNACLEAWQAGNVQDPRKVKTYLLRIASFLLASNGNGTHDVRRDYKMVDPCRYAIDQRRPIKCSPPSTNVARCPIHLRYSWTDDRHASLSHHDHIAAMCFAGHSNG